VFFVAESLFSSFFSEAKGFEKKMRVTTTRMIWKKNALFLSQRRKSGKGKMKGKGKLFFEVGMLFSRTTFFLVESLFYQVKVVFFYQVKVVFFYQVKVVF